MMKEYRENKQIYLTGGVSTYDVAFVNLGTLIAMLSSGVQT